MMDGWNGTTVIKKRNFAFRKIKKNPLLEHDHLYPCFYHLIKDNYIVYIKIEKKGYRWACT